MQIKKLTGLYSQANMTMQQSQKKYYKRKKYKIQKVKNEKSKWAKKWLKKKKKK